MVVDCSNISVDDARQAIRVLNTELIGRDSCGFDVYPFAFDSAGRVVTSVQVLEPCYHRTLSETEVETIFRCVSIGIHRAFFASMHKGA